MKSTKTRKKNEIVIKKPFVLFFHDTAAATKTISFQNESIQKT